MIPGHANTAQQTDEVELLLRVAWMYHYEGLTQSVIADALGMPRAKIIRLLKEGVDQGLVSVQLSHAYYNCLRLESDVKSTFGLRDAMVIPSPQRPEQLTDVLGKAAATLLQKVLKPGMTLGTAWGNTILATAQAFKPTPLDDASVVMMLGGIPNSMPALNPNDIARLFAERLGGHTYYLYAPALVERPGTRDALLADETVQAPLRLARASNVALLGAGTTTASATLAITGVVTRAQLAELRARGAVGDILARFFDAEGRPVPSEVDDRVIGLELRDLAAIDTTILVAGGAEKVPTLLGAMRGGYIDVLVTDEDTSVALLDVARARREAVER